MPSPYSVDDFQGKIDSLYRLVIVGSRRANQITKNDSHGFGTTTSANKPTIRAVEEVLAEKVSFYSSDEEEDHYLE